MGRFRQIIVCALCCALCIPTSLASATPQPTTPEIEAKRQELAEVQAELDRLGDQLSMQVEEYNEIEVALAQTEALIEETEAQLEVARADVARAQAQLNSRATAIYKDGGSSFLEVLMGTATFSDFLVRLDILRIINEQDARLVDEVKRTRRQVEELQSSLEQRAAEQRVLRDEAASKKASIERTIQRRQQYADSLDDEIKRLIAEEEERQRRLAEERARQAEEAARRAEEAAKRAAEEASDQGDGEPDPGFTDSEAGRPEVVEEALKYLGVPYVWGGSTPEGFDCSGFTQYVYAQVGISIPRTSRSQFQSGTRIPAERTDLLALGDLVFFGYDGDPGRVHHVGIYCGDGNYIHAPFTGEVVRVSSLAERIETKGDYVGASRF